MVKVKKEVCLPCVVQNLRFKVPTLLDKYFPAEGRDKAEALSNALLDALKQILNDM